MTEPLVPSLDHIRRAYAETAKATQMTPLLESTALARETGAARVFVNPNPCNGQAPSRCVAPIGD